MESNDSEREAFCICNATAARIVIELDQRQSARVCSVRRFLALEVRDLDCIIDNTEMKKAIKCEFLETINAQIGITFRSRNIRLGIR